MHIKQISSLEKITNNLDYSEIKEIKAFRGERVSYQIGVSLDRYAALDVELESSLSDYIKLYKIKSVPCDVPYTEPSADDNYLTKEPALIPDVLIPIEDEKNVLGVIASVPVSLWVDIALPQDIPAGKYEILIRFTHHMKFPEVTTNIYEKKMTVEVLEKKLPEPKLVYARWLHTDCIADAHHVEIHSEEHWKLIEDYIRAAAEIGVNMILVPVHTPPLDTDEGVCRPNVGIVDIEKNGDKYTFGFEKFERFINICKKHGIKYFEIAHMFSQGYSKFAPNIMVTENGKRDYMFGWHTTGDDPEYTNFVPQYVAAIAAEVEREGIAEQTYFHICDEPRLTVIENYRRAYSLIKPNIGRCKTVDALSDFDFVEEGLVEIPITLICELKKFLENKLPEQWIYYACVPQKDYINCHLAMSLSRVRMLGFLLYKYDIKGFLHWGLNFYYCPSSKYAINPYLTTSVDHRYPSGDPFVLYPAHDGVYHSMRGKVTLDAMNDLALCQMLEEKIGRDAIVKMIDEEAGMDIYFNRFPEEADFFTRLRDKMISML